MCKANRNDVINLQSWFPVNSFLILHLVNTGIVSKKLVSPSVDMTNKLYGQCSSKANMTQYLWAGKSYQLQRTLFANALKVYLRESRNSYSRLCVRETSSKLGLKHLYAV